MRKAPAEAIVGSRQARATLPATLADFSQLHRPTHRPCAVGMFSSTPFVPNRMVPPVFFGASHSFHRQVSCQTNTDMAIQPLVCVYQQHEKPQTVFMLSESIRAVLPHAAVSCPLAIYT